MTHATGGQSPPSTTEAAKDEAREVASTAAGRGGEVAQTAADEAKHVAAHAQREARDLLREGREQLESQARDGQRKAAESLHQLAGQLERMAEQTDSPGVAADVARQVSGRTRSVADWLEHREPGDLLDEVRRFARRRPGTFLVGAAVAGALVGRLTRGVVAQQKEPSPDDRGATVPAAHDGPAGTPPVPTGTPGGYPGAPGTLGANGGTPDGGPAAAGPLGAGGGSDTPVVSGSAGYTAPQPTETTPSTAPAPGGYTAPQPPEPLPQPRPRFDAPGQVP